MIKEQEKFVDTNIFEGMPSISAVIKSIESKKSTRKIISIYIDKSKKRSKTKECYRGLNYEYMEDYIKTHGSKEECAENLAEFKEQKLISLCHSTSRRYPTIKKWFLGKYPEVMEFGMPDAAAENNSAEDNELAYEMPVKISA